MRSAFKALLISAVGVLIWFISTISSSGRRKRTGQPRSQNAGSEFFQFLRDFTEKGGLRHLFPGDDKRDTSVQFELISQVNVTTTVGRPISVTSRNVGQDRRHMRYFGEGI